MKDTSNIEAMNCAPVVPSVFEKGYYLRECIPSEEFSNIYDWNHEVGGLSRPAAALYHLYNCGSPAGDWLVILEHAALLEPLGKSLETERFVVLDIAFPVRSFMWDGRQILKGVQCVFDTKTGSVVYVSDAVNNADLSPSACSLSVHGNLLVVRPDFRVVYLPSMEILSSFPDGVIVAGSDDFIVVCDSKENCGAIVKIDKNTGVMQTMK